MKEINLNNAATSGKKPDIAIEAMVNYIKANDFKAAGRGGGADFIELEGRLALAGLFGITKDDDLLNIIFTSSATMSLNMIINGALKKGDHVITTSLEHNAVARPLALLEEKGIIELTYMPCEKDGNIDVSSLAAYIKPNTKLMIMTHASNVTGAILPYEHCAKIAKEHGVNFVLDAAQTAGLIDINFERSDIAALVFTGHKTLMGPVGTGGFIIKSRFAEILEPFISGGTGSISHLLKHPEFMPDKFSAGTPNTLGILGLTASVNFINKTRPANILKHELALMEQFIDGVSCEDIIIYGPSERVPLLSFNIKGVDNGILEGVLYNKFNLASRSGLHCSPLAHKSLGTYPKGALRISFGYFNTADEVSYAIEAINKIIKNKEGIEKWI